MTSHAATSWSFVDRPDAEQLLGCVAGFDPVFVSVARDEAPRMVIDDDGRGTPIAVWTADATFVDSAAIGVTGAEWVRIDRSDSAVVQAVSDALGPTLADWVFTEALPAAPEELVAAVVDAAVIVERAPPTDRSGRVFEATVPAELVTTEAESHGDLFPILTFTINDGRIATIAARPARDPTEFGFRWEFDPTPPVVADPPDDWRNADAAEVAAPLPTDVACEIGE